MHFRRMLPFVALAMLTSSTIYFAAEGNILSSRSLMTPEQKQIVAELKQDVGRIQQDIESASKDDATFGGGLIKTLIKIRLEVLKTNEAVIEQRIHALESGAKMTVVLNSFNADSDKAVELGKEIETQKAKMAEARAEADRYSGGLIKALAETSIATATNSLAMLEQQYFVAKYGLAIPPLPALELAPTETDSKAKLQTATVVAAPEIPTVKRPKDCLKIETFDSSILSTNNLYTELAWKIDVSNSCEAPFRVRVTFTIYDDGEFELDSASEEVDVPAQATGKARGKMLVSPPEKARRMVRQGASLALR